jgi:uncharacterized protein YbaP (TraB family)
MMRRALARCLALAACLAVLPAAAAEFLWEVSSLTNRAYLFGTVHAGKAAWYPLPKPVEEAFADASVLVVEADITDAAGLARTTPAMVLKPPATLAQVVPAEDYARFRKQLARYQVPEADVASLRPFMAISLLVFAEWGRLGYLPQHGVDGYLIGRARALGKRIVEIEGLDVQAQLIASLSAEQNRLLFASTLTALESGLTGEQITGMVNAWQAGDPNLLLEIARKYNEQVPGAKEIEDKFIWSRHEAMAGKIEGYLNRSKERHFIAVGSLHLAGPKGLVEMLRSRGYTVRQL